jgi:hypothetical protein
MVRRLGLYGGEKAGCAVEVQLLMVIAHFPIQTDVVSSSSWGGR